MADPIATGEVIAGKYRVERVIARGGMGMVLLATHLQLGETVAIKLLLPEVVAREDTLARFLREARAAARLKNEHVVRVFDVGTTDRGQIYMVMEFLEGTDLDQAIRSRGPLPISEAVDYLLQACEGVAEAHRMGIIHRDLKPA
ncbi:MAG TPA: serine/threonine-protein kinase, partial [Polyangiaceae bacterium]